MAWVLLLIVWLISPIVLIILLVNKNNELKRVRKLLEETLENRKEIQRDSWSEPVQADTEEKVQSEQTITEEMPQAEQTIPEETAQPAQSIYVQRPGSSASVNRTSETGKDQTKSNNDATEQRSIAAQRRAAAQNNVVAKQRRNEEKQQIPAIVWLFGIGILLMLTAAAIFATSSTWNMLPAIGKIAVLLVTVSVFYVVAYISKSKLELEKTSITFFILGSTFMAVVNIAAAYLGWYGDYYMADGDGIQLIWSISTFITAVCMIVGYLIYRTRILGLLGYLFMLLTVMLGAAFATRNMVCIAICMGVALIIAQAYVYFDENRRGIVVVGKSQDIMCYIFAAEACIIALCYGDDSDIPLIVMSVVALVLAGVRSYLQLRYETDRKNILGIIASCLAVVTLGAGMRVFEYFYQRLEVSLVIFVVAYTALTVMRRKDVYNRYVNLCVSSFSEVLIFVAMIAQFIEIAFSEANISGVLIIVLAAVLYVLEHLNSENRMAVMSALTFYWVMLLVLGRMWDGSNELTVAVVETTIAVISVVAGRLIYRKVVAENENGVLIDWMSICSFSMLFWVYLQYSHDDTGTFVTLLMWAVYVASYYGRQNWITDRIALTVAIGWAAIVCGNQPFVEISHDVITEWWIAVIIIATGLIGIVWRRYGKAYSFVWLVVTSLCFIGEAVEIGLAGEGSICIAKMVAYLLAVAVLAAFALIKKNKVLTVEVGVVLLLFSALSFSIDALPVFIAAMVMAAGYFVYLHYDMSVFSILPVIQMYITIVAQDVNEVVWLIVFIAVVVLGFVLHMVWEDDEHRVFSDDILGISAIIPVIAIWSIGDDKWAFVGTMLLALYMLSFYKRYSDDSQALINKILLSVASVVVALAWITQPFVDMSSFAETEWMIIAFMGTCIFNMIVVYKHDTNDTWGWITFAVAIICVLVQAQCAIFKGELAAALILGISMLLVLLWAYATKRKQWFMLAAITLIAQCIYASRAFWTSIAWWVYLLVAGVALITIAARSEYRKRQGIEEKRDENKHFLQGWRL